MPLLLVTALVAGPASAHRLGIEGTRFTIDGQPKFLLGISYYGGLAAPAEAVERDLDDLAAAGFNWIRLWATWAYDGHDVSAVDPQGNAREPYLGRLKALLTACDRRGMVVDVTLERHSGGLTNILRDHAGHLRAAETLARELKPWRNAYFDLGNERSLKVTFVSYEECGAIADAVRAIDPDRLVTASDVGEITADKVRDYLQVAKVDFIAPHRPRNSASARANGDRCRETLKLLADYGRLVPVHYQEPFRRDFYDFQPEVDDFMADLDGAMAGGAAGWCLHNGSVRGPNEGDGRPRRSFDLRPAEGRLMDQLDEVEREVVRRIRARQGT
jgi:hypothetical protein